MKADLLIPLISLALNIVAALLRKTKLKKQLLPFLLPLAGAATLPAISSDGGGYGDIRQIISGLAAGVLAVWNYNVYKQLKPDKPADAE